MFKNTYLDVKIKDICSKSLANKIMRYIEILHLWKYEQFFGISLPMEVTLI